MGFSKQEHWSGLPCPPPGDLPDPGIEPMSLTSPALAGRFFTTRATWEALAKDICQQIVTWKDVPTSYVIVLLAQSSLTLHNPWTVLTRLFCPWDFPGKNTWVVCHSLLQRIFLVQGLNPSILYCRQILYCLSHQGSPHMTFSSVQFSSVSRSCPILCDPMNHSMPGLPIHHKLPEFTQTHVYLVSDAIQPSHPLSSRSPPDSNPFQHQGLFQWVNSSHEVAKVLEFQL